MIATLQGPLGRLVCDLLRLFWLVLLARVIVSWVVFAGGRPPPDGPVRTAVDLLERITEPVLQPIRKIVPPAGMFDVSVLVAFAIILVLQLALC